MYSRLVPLSSRTALSEKHRRGVCSEDSGLHLDVDGQHHAADVGHLLSLGQPGGHHLSLHLAHLRAGVEAQVVIADAGQRATDLTAAKVGGKLLQPARHSRLLHLGLLHLLHLHLHLLHLLFLHLHHLELHVRRKPGQAARVERWLEAKLRQVLQPAWLAQGGVSSPAPLPK